MKQLSEEKIIEILKTTNIEQFINQIKDVPGFELYKRAVLERTENTMELLQMSALLQALMDNEFNVQMIKLSQEIFFGMIDARLRTEILGESR